VIAEQTFETLSGGQQARVHILLFELCGATMLLLDEPTDYLVFAADGTVRETDQPVWDERRPARTAG